MQSLIKIFCLSFFLFSLSSCEKELTQCQLLEGDWEGTSFRIDGDEYLGTIVRSFTIDFGKLSDSEGKYDLILLLSDNTSDSDSGNYETNTSCDEMELQESGSAAVEYEFEIVGDKLTLNATIDGYAVTMKFKRD